MRTIHYVAASVLRWGQPYHEHGCRRRSSTFARASRSHRVSRANGGLIQRDMRKAARARDVLREIPIAELVARVGKAGELYANAELPMGDGSQTPDEFVRAQSGTTGIPERLCRANMKKNTFVLAEMGRILESLTRGLDLDVLSTRATAKSAACRSAFRPKARCSVSCCRRTHPAFTRCGCRSIPLQIGLVLKPGPQEPWTPFRMAEAFFQAGIPREAISIYPGEGDVGAAVLDGCGRSLIFGGTATVERYRGNPHVQAHGPGFSKILLGDDQVDQLGEVPRRDGRQRVREQRTRLHQLLGDLGQPPRACRSRRPSPASGRRSAAAAGRSRSEPGGVHRAGSGRRDLPGHRRRSPGAWRDRCDREAPATARASSSRDAPTTCCRPSSTASRRTPRSRRRNTCSRS